jgi:sialidase-1
VKISGFLKKPMNQMFNLMIARRLSGCGLFAHVLLVFTFVGAGVVQAAEPFLERSAIWTAGKDGYHTYRIPALLVTQQNTTLAFCEGRKTSQNDHGDVDLLIKRSTDGGRTWSAQRIVYEVGGDAKITIGNPCPVVDAKTRVIWLPFTRDNKEVLVTSSSNDGESWSTPINISSTTTKPDWVWVATGPGVGIQLSHGPHQGRLVIPCDHKRNLAEDRQEMNSHMMLSDDRGATWFVSTPIQTGGNECQVIQRDDGSLLVNTRMQGDWQGYRGIATSQDGGVTWSAISQEKQLPCSKCQASLIRYSTTSASGRGRLLFSNPEPNFKNGMPSGARVNLTVRSSVDDGATWPTAKKLHNGPSAYSSLARLADGTVLCLYEGGEKHYRESIQLARFNLEWLSAP